MDEPAILLRGEEQLSWHDVAFRRSPDIAAHGFAGGELRGARNQPDSDRGRRARHYVVMLPNVGVASPAGSGGWPLRSYLQVQAL